MCHKRPKTKQRGVGSWSGRGGRGHASEGGVAVELAAIAVAAGATAGAALPGLRHAAMHAAGDWADHEGAGVVWAL